MKKLFYFFIKYMLYVYNFFYFKKIRIYGRENIPKDGGILFSPNHQGAFLDPLLVGTFTPGQVTSLTRSDVFGGIFQWFMDALKMLPVYRIRNGYANLKKNDATFARCYELLSKKQHLLMFSEAGHHEEYFLLPLSKGSSRLAYTAQNQYPSQKMYLMPVGINYSHHHKPRCVLHLVFGKPIALQDYCNNGHTDPQNINAIRDDLQVAMKACLWLPEDDQEYAERKKRINACTSHNSFSDIKKALQKQDLSNLPLAKPRPFGIQFLIVVLSIPNGIPLFLIKKILGLFDDIVFYNSIKYGFGLVVFAIWWAIAFLAFYLVFNLLISIIFLICSVGFLFIRQYFIYRFDKINRRN